MNVEANTPANGRVSTDNEARWTEEQRELAEVDEEIESDWERQAGESSRD